MRKGCEEKIGALVEERKNRKGIWGEKKNGGKRIEKNDKIIKNKKGIFFFFGYVYYLKKLFNTIIIKLI